MPSTTMSCTQEPSVPRTFSWAISEMYSCARTDTNVNRIQLTESLCFRGLKWARLWTLGGYIRYVGVTVAPSNESYRNNQRRDPAGHAGENSAHVEHQDVLRCNDHGEATDEGQSAQHQAELPADPPHHPAPHQPPSCCSQRHDGLKRKKKEEQATNTLDPKIQWRLEQR